MQKCPQCAEMVQDDALVCPHCRFSLKMNYLAVLCALLLGLFVVIFFGDLS